MYYYIVFIIPAIFIIDEKSYKIFWNFHHHVLPNFHHHILPNFHQHVLLNFHQHVLPNFHQHVLPNFHQHVLPSDITMLFIKYCSEKLLFCLLSTIELYWCVCRCVYIVGRSWPLSSYSVRPVLWLRPGVLSIIRLLCATRIVTPLWCFVRYPVTGAIRVVTPSWCVVRYPVTLCDLCCDSALVWNTLSGLGMWPLMC